MRARSSLIARVEQARQAEPAAGADSKLRLEISELRELVDDRSGEVDRLIKLLGQPSCCKFWLRRTEAAPGQPEVIAFHRDVSRRTLQVPLNDPAEYDGGRLVLATRNKGRPVTVLARRRAVSALAPSLRRLSVSLCS